MGVSYVPLLTFLIITIFYFTLIKPNHDQKSYLTTGLYFVCLVIIESIINITAISEKCGGNMNDNMGMALYSTIFPWVLIFGVLMLVLELYPGFKSAFANVIGYYFVYSRANDILANLIPPETKTNPELALTLSKIYGDKAILINKMTPSNFTSFIAMLTPLFRKDKDNGTYINSLKTLVDYKENVGEFCWYLYTAILVISIVEYNIASMKCKKSDKQIDQEIEDYKNATSS